MVFLFLEFGEGSGTGVIVDGFAPAVAVGAKPESPVVDVPTSTEGMGECLFLGSGRVEPESVSELHNYHYTLVRRIVKCLIIHGFMV